MPQLTDTHVRVLKNYSRSIVHLRRQVSVGRFGLVFGAGFSKPFGVPTWTELVQRLADDPTVNGTNVLKAMPPRAGLPHVTEMLFEHFRRQRYAQAGASERHTRQLDYRIAADWREILRNNLYDSVTTNVSELFASHPYLKACLPLIRRSDMTVTYNFDDFIEQAILYFRETGAKSRGFESVTNPWTQFRRKDAVIYHPNGVVPRNPMETPSDRLVFSEASYADQLIGIFAGDHAGLRNHLSKRTCLFVGLSLEDETIRSILMQGTRSSPGNCHYFIHYLHDNEVLDEELRIAIRMANFKVYNLVTLFLTSSEIRAMLELLDVDEWNCNEFCDSAAEKNISVRFRFFVTGALGVGKSTLINHLRNLVVLDEWLEQRPDLLARDWESLSPAEKEQVDAWILGQFKLKDASLRNDREGIFILDRGPLDPISFTPDDEWNTKALRLVSTLCGDPPTWRVQDGRVIRLVGDCSELALRVIMTQRKQYTSAKLEKMQDRLHKAYGTEGVVVVDTRGLTPYDVARRVAEVIHLHDYVPVCDLHSRLALIGQDGANV